MMGKLLRDEHKGDWYQPALDLSENLQFTLALMRKEVVELSDEIDVGNLDEIKKEAGDVANFALMIIDIIERSKSGKL